MNVSAVKSFFPVSKRVSFLRPRLVLFIILGVSQIVVSCDAREQVRLIVGNESFIVEVADSPDERARGLMHRRTLAKDRGMLFVFPYDQRVSFWDEEHPRTPLGGLYLPERNHPGDPSAYAPLGNPGVFLAFGSLCTGAQRGRFRTGRCRRGNSY